MFGEGDFKVKDEARAGKGETGGQGKGKNRTAKEGCRKETCKNPRRDYERGGPGTIATLSASFP